MLGGSIIIRMISRQALAALLFSAIALAQPSNPSKDWERAKPEDEGYSSKRLDPVPLSFVDPSTSPDLSR